MQKRKSPVLLVTILIIVIGFIFVGNTTGVFFRPIQQEDPLEQIKKESEAPKKVTEKDKQVRKAAMEAATKNARKQNPEDEEGNGENPAEPSILIPDVKPYKPIYNETSTSGQWYKSESNEQKRGEDLAKKRGE